MVQKVFSSLFILLVTALFFRECKPASSSDNSGIQSEQSENLENYIEEKEILDIKKELGSISEEDYELLSM